MHHLTSLDLLLRLILQEAEVLVRCLQDRLIQAFLL
jgi:hypothetical protein